MMTSRQFGGFVLDTAAGELRRGSDRIEMRPKLFALLLYFVEHHGRLIPKEELMSAVWPDVHVTDGSLNRSIAELRDVLGDDSQKPHLIETVPRRGYRFVADVHDCDTPSRRSSTFLLVHRDRTIHLAEGENVVGRMPECEVQIVASSVSRRHARLTISANGVTIEDLGSTNGTFVDEQRIDSPVVIAPGQSLRVGRESLRLIDAATLHASTEKVS